MKLHNYIVIKITHSLFVKEILFALCQVQWVPVIFFACLDAVRVQTYAKIQLPIHIISQFSIDIIAHENILEWIHEASLLQTVLQTSGSVTDFVGNWHEQLKRLYSRNPFLSEENGTQYWIITTEKAEHYLQIKLDWLQFCKCWLV